MIGTESGVGAQERHSGQTQGLADTAGPLADTITKDFAAGLFVVRGDPDPGREMIGRGKLADIGADFGEDSLNGRGAEAIHIKQVNACDAAQMRLR